MIQTPRRGDPSAAARRPLRRGEAIELYKEWIVRAVPGHGDGRHLLSQLGELENQVLGCFCAPEGGVAEHDPLVCHGQVLLILVAWRRKKIDEKTSVALAS